MMLRDQLRRDAKINFATQLTKRLSDPSEFAAWIEGRMAAGLKILSAWNTVMEQLGEAFGPSGTPGDAALILYVASRLGKIYQSALEWKIEFHQIQVDDGFETLRTATADFMDGVPTSFDRLIAELGALLEDFDMNHKPGERREYELDWIVSVSPEIAARYDLEYAKFKERYSPRGN